MRPIRESLRADDQYGPFMWGDVDLLENFLELSARVRELVPACVGMSASLREHGVTLTLVASDERIALLDGVQYVDGGPCVDALREVTVVDASNQEALQKSWELFSAASLQNGVEATLSLPVPWEGSGVFGFNLYASAASAFEGHQDELARVLGAWAGGAVTDQDLPFSTRDLARLAPTILKESTDLAVVAGLVAHARGIELSEAETRLRRASVRAAIPLTDLVDALRQVLTDLPPASR